MDIVDRAKKIKCILLDVDGTLTEGSVLITELKEKNRFFSIKDGLGLKIWKSQGFKIGFITGDNTESSKERAKMLDADFQYYNCSDKKTAILEILNTGEFKANELAFIGDDLIDIPALRRVGFAVAVKDGVIELDNSIHYRTNAHGGRGAVREVIEIILKAKGLWDNIVETYYND
jgi:3-deoxy-D-manno-octulosonate 8-phosphate phosphatase (KDO 8-P phosphatase)